MTLRQNRSFTHTDSYLYTALSGQFNSCVVVAAAQQMLHHHPVHAFLLPQVDGGRLVAAVLLQVLDATLTQLGALIFCLDGLCSLWDKQTQDIYEKLNMHHVKKKYKFELMASQCLYSALFDFLKEGTQIFLFRRFFLEETNQTESD